MSFSNRIFNVNGETKTQLLAAVKLAFDLDGSNTLARSWTFDPAKGIVLSWSADKGNPFPVGLEATAATELIWQWLTGPDAKSMVLKGEDENADHDGDNIKGWRAYVERWGHVGNNTYAILAVTPAYLWIGK